MHSTPEVHEFNARAYVLEIEHWRRVVAHAGRALTDRGRRAGTSPFSDPGPLGRRCEDAAPHAPTAPVDRPRTSPRRVLAHNALQLAVVRVVRTALAYANAKGGTR